MGGNKWGLPGWCGIYPEQLPATAATVLCTFILQLVVRDGMKETEILNSAMAKVTKFCSLLHSNCGLKEAFEAEYGANRSIPSAVWKRWNTTLRLVGAITDMDPQSLNTLLEAQGHKGLCLSARELAERACGNFGPISSSNRPHTMGESGDSQCGSPLHSLTQHQTNAATHV